jgi:hypothetical protein
MRNPHVDVEKMNLKKITLEDYPKYKPYFENQRYHLCCYNLSTIIAWQNDNYQPFGTVVNNTLVVGSEFAQTARYRHLILPISPTSTYTPEDLVRLARRAGHDAFWFVPQCYIDIHGLPAVKRWFHIQHHNEFDDYIYQRDDLAHLKGNRYAKKRNLIHQFERAYLNGGRISVEPITPDSVGECLDFLERWCAERACALEANEDLACERIAAINTLSNLKPLEGRGLQLRIDERVHAFAVASHLTDDMGTLQFQKANAKIKGLYQYFDRECARRLFTGYSYINKESDMGQPGLAKAKQSYHPVMKITAYKLILRDASRPSGGDE